jgi:hypothetical protein
MMCIGYGADCWLLWGVECMNKRKIRGAEKEEEDEEETGLPK